MTSVFYHDTVHLKGRGSHFPLGKGINNKMKNSVCLISFYNPSSLGLRYLEDALSLAGYDVTLIFLKKFNSVQPKAVSKEELEHLCALIREQEPVAIGFSVMTSLYLDAVQEVSKHLKETFSTPIVWGGVYASMFHEKSMEYADFVIRGEGEEALVELVDMLKTGREAEFSRIENLVYRDKGTIYENDLRELQGDLDKYGQSNLGGNNKYLIEDNMIKNMDPRIEAHGYEIACSRGCPFACSYCCAVNLKRMYAGKGKYVRFRSVDAVIEELLLAKKQVKKLKFIRFWDEIFCDDADWVEAFVKRYKKEINLPFEIWGHPLKCDEAVIAKLKTAGLYKVVMGIQSGSPYIRKEVFHRRETQEDIIAASKVLAKCKVPQVIYDFMLRHPFETHASLRETYELSMALEPPFELQMHGLNFLPGTDIVGKALEQKLVDPEAMEKLMYAPMQEQYDTYWQNETSDPQMNYIYKLIYLTQFSAYREKTKGLVDGYPSKVAQLDKLYKKGMQRAKLRYFYKRGKLVLHSYMK